MFVEVFVELDENDNIDLYVTGLSSMDGWFAEDGRK